MLKVLDSRYDLEEIEKHYKLNYHVLESMADWVRVLDVDGTVIYANKVMKEALGEDIIGHSCNIHCQQETPCCFCIVERSIQGGETIQKEEIINGKFYSVKASPVKNDDGNIIGAVEVFRDVTRERSLELKLRAKNTKMTKDLSIARTIQEKILPHKGVIDNINVDYVYKPSEMLSGDMFDIYHIDKDNIGVYISDVAGHGVAASMMTMFIRQSMRFIKDDILSPSIALSELHRRFRTLGLEIDKYFTIFYGVFNKSTHEFKYSNAGHNSIPLKYNKDEKIIEELKITGSPISILFDRVSYKEKMIQLKKNDQIILYTDGITEITDIDGNEYGIERLIEQIKKYDDNLMENVVNDIGVFSKGILNDDFAMVLLEVIK